MQLSRLSPAPLQHTVTPEPPVHTGPALLTDITAGLAAGDDVAAVLCRFLAPVMALAGAQAAAVRQLSANGEQLELLGARGLPESALRDEQVVDRQCGACGEAVAGQSLVWVNKLHACARHTPGPFFSQQCQRMLVVPLQHRGQTLGVYNLFFEGGAAPSAEVQTLLQTVGELLGLALHNTRLEQENLQHRLQRERQMMAAELHDSLAQSIAYLKMRLPLLQDALLAHDETRALQHCAEVRSVATQAHASLRSMLTHFRAPMDPQGLAHALQVRLAQQRQADNATVHYRNELPAGLLSAEQETQVFHIVHEALNNVLRHAHAQHVSVHLGPAADGRSVHVRVLDDGAGMVGAGDESAAAINVAGGSTHYGMEIMDERARRLGGTLQVGPGDDGGTRVELMFPLAQPAALQEAPSPGVLSSQGAH